MSRDIGLWRLSSCITSLIFPATLWGGLIQPSLLRRKQTEKWRGVSEARPQREWTGGREAQADMARAGERWAPQASIHVTCTGLLACGLESPASPSRDSCLKCISQAPPQTHGLRVSEQSGLRTCILTSFVDGSSTSCSVRTNQLLRFGGSTSSGSLWGIPQGAAGLWINPPLPRALRMAPGGCWPGRSSLFAQRRAHRGGCTGSPVQGGRSRHQKQKESQGRDQRGTPETEERETRRQTDGQIKTVGLGGWHGEYQSEIRRRESLPSAGPSEPSLE